MTSYAAEVDRDDLARLSADPRLASVEEDGVVRAATQQLSAPWGLDRLDQQLTPLDAAFSTRATGRGVAAYVVDSGVRTTHAEFGGAAVSGVDLVDGDADATDCDGHGTHAAGSRYAPSE